VQGRVRRRAAWAGLAFGFGWFLSGVSWLFISMHRFGGMPAPMAGAALVLFALYLAVFTAVSLAVAAPALHRAFASGAARPAIGAALQFAACWGAGELLRAYLFTGFPWLSSGYAHVDGPLAGFAPIVGVHGTGALAALMAAGLAIGVSSIVHLRSAARRGSKPWPAASSPLTSPPSPSAAAPAGAAGRRPGLAALACVLVPALLGVATRPILWSEPTGEFIQVRLLQGNVPQQMKFDAARSLAAMQSYAGAIGEAPADLVVLPETAWTVPWTRTPTPIAEQIVDGLRRNDAIAVIGMPLPARTSDGSPTVSNSVTAIGGQGPLPWRYDKRHLVPFGEFVPFGFGWFVRMMHIPLGDFGRGDAVQPALELRGQRLMFDICYEDIFGDELAAQVREGATVLVNVSNIAWFGDSHALPQHLQIARMRALELARPMLRSTNTGVTAAIDARGDVISLLEPYTQGALAVELRGTTGLTPYARIGDWAPLLLVLLFAAGGFALGLPGGKREKRNGVAR
jgi:apolipoprotein N-acyltransferase